MSLCILRTFNIAQYLAQRSGASLVIPTSATNHWQVIGKRKMKLDAKMKMENDIWRDIHGTHCNIFPQCEWKWTTWHRLQRAVQCILSLLAIESPSVVSCYRSLMARADEDRVAGIADMERIYSSRWSELEGKCGLDQDLWISDKSNIEKESSRPAVWFTLDAKGRWSSLSLDTWLGRTTWSCEDNRMLSRDNACIGTHHTPIHFCVWQMVIAPPTVKGFKLAHFVCHNDGWGLGSNPKSL